MRQPVIQGAKGHYAVAVTTGAIGAGASANSEILQFRWTDTDDMAVIYEVGLTGMYATTAFAAGAIHFRMTVARSFTASGSGGVGLEFGGDSNIDNAALRSNMGDSLVGSFRVSDTAALTAGTQSLEANDIGRITTHSSAGWNGATPIIGSVYLPTTTLFKANIADGQYPLILDANEGFVIRATVPATGVWVAGLLVKWAEVRQDYL